MSETFSISSLLHGLFVFWWLIGKLFHLQFVSTQPLLCFRLDSLFFFVCWSLFDLFLLLYLYLLLICSAEFRFFFFLLHFNLSYFCIIFFFSFLVFWRWFRFGTGNLYCSYRHLNFLPIWNAFFINDFHAIIIFCYCWFNRHYHYHAWKTVSYGLIFCFFYFFWLKFCLG